MENFNFWQVLLIAFIPALISGLIAYLANSHEIQRYKADSMAERAAKHYLNHEGYIDRKFITIQKHIGGWDNEPDELRRILVRAGAVRTYRQEKGEKIEYWYLLDRLPEKIEKWEANKID